MRHDRFIDLDGHRVMLSSESTSTRVGHDSRATRVTDWTVTAAGAVIARARSKASALARAREALRKGGDHNTPIEVGRYAVDDTQVHATVVFTVLVRLVDGAWEVIEVGDVEGFDRPVVISVEFTRDAAMDMATTVLELHGGLLRSEYKHSVMERMSRGDPAAEFRAWLQARGKYARTLYLLDTPDGMQAFLELARMDTRPRPSRLAQVYDTLVGLGWSRTPSGVVELTIGGGVTGGALNPEGHRIVSAERRGPFLSAMLGDGAVVAQVQWYDNGMAEDLAREFDAEVRKAGTSSATPKQPKPVKVSAGLAVVKPSGKMLLVHPTNAKWQGSYGIPKGQVEPDDASWFERALTEVQEETGLDLRAYADESATQRYVSLKDKHGTLKKRVVYWVVPVPEGFAPDVLPKDQLQLEEVDWAGFLTPTEAMGKVTEHQKPILDHAKPRTAAPRQGPTTDWFEPRLGGRITVQLDTYLDGQQVGHRVEVTSAQGKTKSYFWSRRTGWNHEPPARVLGYLQERGFGEKFRMAGLVPASDATLRPWRADLPGWAQDTILGLEERLPPWLDQYGRGPATFRGTERVPGGVRAQWTTPQGDWQVLVHENTSRPGVQARGKFVPKQGAPVVGPLIPSFTDADPELLFPDEWMFALNRRTEGRRTGGRPARMETMPVCPPTDGALTIRGFPPDQFQRASLVRSVKTDSKVWARIGDRARVLLKKHGLRLGKQLGCGSFACAYDLPGETQWVAKITGDPSDAAAWHRVLGALNVEAWEEGSWAEFFPTMMLAQVKCVEAFPIPVPVEQVAVVEGSDRLTETIKTRRMFLLVQERLEPLGPREEHFFNDPEVYTTALRAGSGSNEKRASLMGKAMSAGLNWEAVQNLVETMRWLRRKGIIWHDLHGGNLMATGRGSRRKYKIVDLGYSEAPPARVAVMEPMRVSTMETCPYTPGKSVAEYMINEHEEVTELLEAVLEATRQESERKQREPGEARQRFEQFAIDLEQHFLSEERDIFPAAMKLGGKFARDIPEFLVQHKPIRALLAEQRARHPRPCLLALGRLKELLQAHSAAEDALDWNRVVVDRLKGGRADTRSPSEFEPEALARGAQIELEHTSDPELAREIAMDHLAEHADYYDPQVGLPAMERRLGQR